MDFKILKIPLSRAVRIPLTVLVLGFALTVATALLIRNRNHVEAEARFERISLNFSAALKNRLNTYVNSLIYTRNLFEIDPDLSENEFGGFVRRMRLDQTLPGIQSIGYVKILPRAEGLKAVKKSGRTLEEAKVPQNSHEPMNVVMYVQPIAASVKTTSQGMNLRSDPYRRATMELAADLGEPVATDHLAPMLITLPAKEFVFLVYVPQYKRGLPLGTVEERRKAIQGFVYGGFRFSNLFSRATEDMRMQTTGIGTEIFDGDSVDEKDRMFSEGDLSREVSFSRTFPVQQANHTWMVRLSAPPQFGPPFSVWIPSVFCLLGFIGTLLLAGLTYRALTIAEQLKLDIVERKKTEAQLQAKNELVEFTSEVGLSLMSEKDLTSIVQMVTDGGTKLVGAKFGAFFYSTINDSGEALMLYTLSGAKPEDFEAFGMPRKTPVFQPTFDGEGIVRSDDITKDPRYGKFGPPFGMPAGHLPVRSFLSTPVVAKSGKVLGGLFFGHPQTSVFNERSEEIVRAIAIQASVAMENATLYREISAARHEADAANHAKTMFLANISHEMRTPLGVMIGHAELGLEESDKSRMRDGFSIIVRNGRDLTQIIGDVLDLSKIEANALVIDEGAANIRHLIEELRVAWVPKAEAKNLRLEIYVDDEVPHLFQTDRTRVKQILVNLLSNAVKFTEKGFVRLKVSYQATPTGILEFVVEDSGPGISKTNRATLFKTFSQGDNSITRKFGGNGLGLALSRQLARALKGELTLRSDSAVKFAEGGSCFALTLPYVAATEVVTLSERAPKDQFPSLHGRKFLIVDDSADNRFLVKTMLNKVGIKSDVAGNGAEGVELALKSNYDVILMDLQMPVLDGYGALEQLRASGMRRPIVAVSAHAFKEEKTKALAKGFDAYLTKPIDRQVFFSTLSELQNL